MGAINSIRDIYMRKIVALISGILGIVLGLYMLIAGLMDITIPKWMIGLFSIVCLVNGILSLMNLKTKQ